MDYFVKNNYFEKIKKNKEIIDKVIKFALKNKIKIIIIPCIEKNYLKENEQRALSLEKDFNKTKVYAHWTNAYAPISTTRRSKKKTFNYY